MDKRLVRVTWLDASDPETTASWFTDKEVDEFAEKACEVVSVGWVKSQTKMYLTLVADYIVNGDGSTTWGRPTKIPNGMVQQIDDLAAVPSAVPADQ